MYDRTVHWNDRGNTGAGNGKRVKEDAMMEHVEATKVIAGTSVCGTY